MYRPRTSFSRAMEQASLGFIGLAVLTGLIAGFGAVGFRMLIGLFHNFAFLGTFSAHYAARVHTPPADWGWWHIPWGAWIIVVPIVGAVLVAFLVKTFAPEAKGHGVPEVMDAIYYKRGIIRPIVAAIKALASALSIGTGGSVGREGPIIQIGSAFGSTVGQILPVTEWQRMTLIACGSAGGIAATFNTPIGGVLFAVELIMPEISARTLVPVALASGAATFISRLFLGNSPAFYIPPLSIHSGDLGNPMSWIAYLAFGVVLGLWSVLFIRSIYKAEDWFDKIPGGYYVRHVIGMALVGVIIYLLMRFSGHYYVEGVGYATVQDILSSRLLAPAFLVLILVLKLIATSLTLGSGGSGGIFSPALFMGATLGAAFAWVVNVFFPGLGIDPVSASVIGMAGIVGGATGAVVTAIVMIFEMTRDYGVIIPLMIAVSVAYGIRRAWMEASIYDMKLRRRGHFIPNVLQTNLYLLGRAKDRIRAPVLRVGPDPNPERLRRVLRRVRRIPHIVVVDRGRVQAVIPANIVRGFGGPEALASAIVHHERQPYVVVAAEDMLFDVIAHLRNAACEVALVTDSGEMHSADEIRGVLTLSDVMQGTQLPRLLLGGRKRTAYREGAESSGS
jgi:chloride channel protein, CIC family